ncbi:hypothetical protein [Enterorhabdus sp. P55]|nr:hypothetical protein [Enterorhabdus sp. P55]
MVAVDGLLVAFMAAVIGSLLYIQLQLRDIAKKLDPEERRRNPRGK